MIHIYLFFWLFFLFPKIKSQNCIGIQIFFQTNHYKKLFLTGYDKDKQLCLECAPNSYLMPSFSSNTYINSTSECLPKSNLDLLYTRKIYVSNETCIDQTSCLGTITSPYDSLMKAINNLHNFDIAGKYLEQNIEILLLGSPHYIFPSEIPYLNMRLFRRMNATIKIGPVFCENESVNGCVFGFRIEKVDLYIKSDSFSFEIYRSFTLYHLNIFGNDIVLSPFSSKSCYNNISICCDSSLYERDFSEEECGLLSRGINLNDKTKLITMTSLFRLRSFYDIDSNKTLNLKETPIPFLNITNVLFQNFYSVKGDFSWLSLIMFNTLGYNIILNKAVLENTFFPFGFLNSVSLEDDPYYKYLNVEEINLLYSKYPNSNLYNNFINISSIIIFNYNIYNFQIAQNYSGTFAPGLINFYLEQSYNAQYSFDKINLVNLDFKTSLYFLTYLVPAKSTYIPTIQFNNTIIQNNRKLSFLDCENDNFIQEDYPFFHLFISGFLLFHQSKFSNTILTSSNNYITSQNFTINIYHSHLLNISDNFAILVNGSLTLKDCIFFAIDTPNSDNFFSFTDSNLHIENVVMLNSTSFNTYSVYFYFFATSNIEINVTNFKLHHVTSYHIFLLECYYPLPNFYLSDILLNFTKGIRNPKWGHFFFLDNGAGASNEIIVSNLVATNTSNLEIILHLSEFNKIEFKNILVENMIGLQYYSFLIFGPEVTNIGKTNSILLSNVTYKNINLNRSIDLFYLGLFGFLTINQCSYINVSFNEKIPEILRVYWIIMMNIGSLLVENSKFEFTKNSFIVSLITIFTIDYISIQNNIFEGKHDNTITRVMAFCAQYFVNFTFINNSVINMSAPNTLTDITDESGVVSVLASGSFYQSLTGNQEVTIIGNYFYGNIGNTYGVLGVFACSKAYIFNNSFYYSQGTNGGALTLSSISYLYVENLIVNNSESIEGGGVYVYDLSKEFIFNNVYFLNSKASKGGALYIASTTNAIIMNINFENSVAVQKGGVIFLTNSFNVSLYNFQSFNSSSSSGGMIYIEYCNLVISQIKCVLSKSSQSGGALSILGSTTIVLMKSNTFIYCSSDSDGGILTSLNIWNLTIFNNFFIYSSTKANGNGIINLSGFYITKQGEKENYGTFSLKNISCMHNIASLGGCLYYSSNNYLYLQDFIISNISGSIFNIESDSSVTFIFKNVMIQRSNYFSYEEKYLGIDLRNPLMFFINLILTLSNFSIENNTAEANLIKINSAYVQILDSKISNFFNTFPDSTISSRFLYVSDASILINNTSFFYSNSSLLVCMILEIRSSTVKILQSFFYDSKTPDLAIISSVDSYLFLYGVEFLNLGGSFGTISLKTSSVNIDNCTFKNNVNTLRSMGDDQASDIIFDDDKILKDNIVILNSAFYHQDKNSLVIKKACNVTIENTLFSSIGISQNNSFSRAIYLDENKLINLTSCIFNNLYAEIGGALSLYQINNANPMILMIKNCTFYNNSAYFGGSIYLRGSIYLKIISSIFQQNIAKNSTASSSKVTSEDCGKGGCILADFEYFSQYSMEINDSIFLNNQAEKYGPTILLKSMFKNETLIFSNNTFEKNWDSLNFTDQISGSPIKAYLLSSGFMAENYERLLNLTKNSDKIKSILKDFQIDYAAIASGQEFNFSAILTDFYDQLLLFESKASAELTCFFYNLTKNNDTTLTNSTNSDVNQNVFVEKSNSQSNNGIFTFSRARIVMPPHNNLSCTITIKIEDTLLFKSSLELGINEFVDRNIKLFWIIYVRNCTKGELLMEDNTCFECLPGTFFNENPMELSISSMKCNNCPDNAYCKGGKNVSPLAGYWRFSDKTSLILECPTQQACMGIGKNLQNLMDLSKLNEEESVSGVCHPNYWGNLCYMCRKGYGRYKVNQDCEECSSLTFIYIKMALSMIFIVSYITVQAKIFSNIDKKDPNLAIMMKLLLNHFQTISMITLIEFHWTVEFNFYFNFLDYLSFLSQDFFIIDCLVQEINQNLLVQKIIFTILLPIILSLVMILVWLFSFVVILYGKSKNSERNMKFILFISEKMRITLLILLFILYPEILRKCFSLLNCLLIDDHDQYFVLTASPNIQCWSGDHTTWVLTVSIPGLVIWGIFTPVTILFILHKYKKKIQNFIFETHQSLAQKKLTTSVDIKIENHIQKNIYLDIEETIQENIFLTKEFPIKNEIKYKTNNQLFLEISEVHIKSRKTIIEEMRVPMKDTPENVNILAEKMEFVMNNDEKIIKDPIVLFEYLAAFSENLKEKSLTKEDLKDNIVRIREEYAFVETKIHENNENDVLLKKSYVETQKKEQIMPKTFLIIKNLGFIYRGYRPEFYFWEAVMFTRKFLLIFIGVFTEFFPKQTKPTILIVILVGYIYIQIKFKPYQFEYLNKLEAYSLIVAFLTGNIGILLFSDFMRDFGTFFLFMIFFINFVYIVVWVKFLIHYGNLRGKVKYILIWVRLIKRRCKSVFG